MRPYNNIDYLSQVLGMSLGFEDSLRNSIDEHLGFTGRISISGAAQSRLRISV